MCRLFFMSRSQAPWYTSLFDTVMIPGPGTDQHQPVTLTKQVLLYLADPVLLYHLDLLLPNAVNSTGIRLSSRSAC